MGARPGRFLSLALATALCVSLSVPSGSALGSVLSTARVERTRHAGASVATMQSKRRIAAVAPAVVETPPTSSQSPVVRADSSPSSVSATIVVDPLAPAVPGELVAVLDSKLVAASSERALEARGARVERVEGDASLLIRAPVGMSAPVFTQMAADTAGVAWVQPNYVYREAYVPNDPMYAQQWDLAGIGAPSAWDVTKGKSSVLVAVVDTGVDYTHPDLVGRIDTVNDYDFVNGDADAMDDNGHGTHVSGIIAATQDNGIGGTGVAPGGRILPVKVLSAAGAGDSVGVAAGIQYAADHGAKIINLSLAGSADRLMGTAVAYARSRGCVVIAAAGNEGSSGGADYPARYPGVVGVGAVDRNNARASFSNYGDGVDVSAPGVGIWSTWPGSGYEAWSGTSMASPFVAGVAALLLSSEPSLDATEVIDRIVAPDRVTPLDPALGMGSGVVSAGKAVGPAASTPGSDIPGTALSLPVTTGVLSRDLDRVYSVYLGAGQTLATTLTADPAALVLGLYLYSPSSQSIATGARLVSVIDESNPKMIRYTATVAGRYYVRVHAFLGSGTYSLVWTRTGSSDDEIPGFALPVSPVGGHVDAVSDQDDVYAVPLSQNDVFVVELTGPPTGADMDLYLYGPDATSILSDPPVAGSVATDTANESFRYRVPRTGVYFVDVNAFSGGGDYRLAYQVTQGAPTDNIPGIVAPPSPLDGTVGGLSSPDDVYKMYVQAGQSVDVTITADRGPGPDYLPWLSLYPPTATDVDAEWASVLEWTDVRDGVGHISDEATSTGYYYIDVYGNAAGAATRYQLTLSTTTAPDDDIPGVPARPSPIRGPLGATTDTDDVFRIHAGAGQWISASLTGIPSVSVDPTDFDLYLYSSDATDTRSATPLAKSDGTAYPKAIGLKAPASGDYYLQIHVFAGAGTYALTWSVRSFATVYTPVAPSKVTHGRRFTVYGYVAPKHTSGTYLVTLRFYLRDSHRAYVYHHSVKARRYNYWSRSKYSVYTSLPHRGVWRVRAVHSDTGMPDALSAYRYVTVR